MNTIVNTIAEKDVERKRVQLDFSSEAYSRLKEIKDLSEAKNLGEVVRNALRVYGWFLEQRRGNFTIQLVKDGRVKEVELIL